MTIRTEKKYPVLSELQSTHKFGRISLDESAKIAESKL